MELECELCVDYLNQAKKPGRKAKGIATLVRDEWRHICLIVGPKSKRVSFKIEGIIANIYDRFINEGKATVELHLPGGSYANVLISGAKIDELKVFINTIKTIKTDPVATAELELDAPEDEAMEAPGGK
eukprot:TRINITY_DN10244_c0_g1_i1.p1 TRINITY_DN10244_c0_g1~~TRINITY_DN10244_c0_g1_i1.p1  ORF type:complete len:129 (+),score=29.81 TRINITY_DN10244_c0_g1_i1:23-409(+)